MAPVIRIDQSVFEELQRQAIPFVETSPNQVLKRILGLSTERSREVPLTTIARGSDCQSKNEFIDELRRWRDSTSETTIGHIGSYGGKAWLFVGNDSNRAYLNADSTRAGIDEFLRNHDAGHTAWKVIRSRNGRPNKVTNDPLNRPIKGLYLFADVEGERNF